MQPLFAKKSSTECDASVRAAVGGGSGYFQRGFFHIDGEGFSDIIFVQKHIRNMPENLENHLQIDRKKCTLYIVTYSCERIEEMR